jgi:hypothetical protein
MKRRRFLRTSAGLAAAALAPGVWSCQAPPRRKRSFDFAAAEEGRCEVPVTRVTPDDDPYVFTYYDICPFSPSQRYLAAARLLSPDRPPKLGDPAEVCVVDLRDRTIEAVYATRCWGFQLGAHLHWGATDRILYTNDVIGGRAVAVRLDLETGEAKAFRGPAYHVAPDESCAIGFPLELLNVTQLGYGPPSEDPGRHRTLPPGAARDEGVWRTDLRTGETRLLFSLADVAARLPAPPPREGGTFYFWHSRFNRQGTAILQVLRCVFPDRHGGLNATVFTMKPDGSGIRYTPGGPGGADPVWGISGGHPNWHPDGEHVLRHLTVGNGHRFCKVRADGGAFTVLSEKLVATGHPSAEPSNRYLVTDRFEEKGGPTRVALRLIDLKRDDERVLCTLPTVDRRNLPDAMYRLDGHPVWSRDYTKVCLQATSRGRRAIFLVDLPL